MWWNKGTQPKAKETGIAARHGTYFRTATFEQRPLHKDDGSFAQDYAWTEYHEAYQQQGGNYLWTINKIKNENGVITSRLQAEGLPFMEALEKLAQFESFQKSQYPDQNVTAAITGLGFKHFKAFAAREGILWDKATTPHTLPHPDAIPPGTFRYEDIEAARKAAEKTEQRPVPQDDILARIFNDASAKGNIDLAIDGLQKAGLIADFRMKLYDFENKLDCLIASPAKDCADAKEYLKREPLCNRSSKITHHIHVEYKSWQGTNFTSETPKSRHHGFALQELDQSYETLRCLEKSGEDTTPLVNMLYTYEMATHLIYAQKLFKHCQDNPQDTASEAQSIKTALADAEMIYKDYLHQQPREMYEALKEKVTSGEHPQKPSFLNDFQKQYKEKKAQYPRVN